MISAPSNRVHRGGSRFKESAPRRWFRRLFLDTLDRALDTDDGRAILDRVLAGRLRRPLIPSGDANEIRRLYPEIGPRSDAAPKGGAPIFITARFRSGSTLVWNLFREVPGMTSYYEPFNERRWFDAKVRGSHTDPTHRGVSDYWKEYEGLSDLARWYDERWIDTDLHMDALAWNPAMARFVERLIQAAPGRAALQFNRVDFRLPWLRSAFPHALIVHLYRNPRDQWCSSLLDPERFSKDQGFAEFAPHDHFYLMRWARDLRQDFPFLDESSVSHPYAIFYYLWKLSYLFGRRYGHHSLAFERLIADPRSELTALFEATAVDGIDLDPLVAMVDLPAPGRWKSYADDLWFGEIEDGCERVMARFAAFG